MHGLAFFPSGLSLFRRYLCWGLINMEGRYPNETDYISVWADYRSVGQIIYQFHVTEPAVIRNIDTATGFNLVHTGHTLCTVESTATASVFHSLESFCPFRPARRNMGP
jgi:hypothetical protein